MSRQPWTTDDTPLDHAARVLCNMTLFHATDPEREGFPPSAWKKRGRATRAYYERIALAVQRILEEPRTP